MKAVNLLPVERRDVKPGAGPAGHRLPLIAAGVVAVAAAGGLSTLVWSSSSSVSSKQKQLSALQSQVASLPISHTTPASAEQAAAVGLAGRVSTIDGIMGDRLAWDQFLGSLSRVIPEDVWLQSLQATTPGAAATLAAAQAAAASIGTTATASTSTSAPTTTPTIGQTFTISGYTYSQPSVARLMRRLAIVPWLTGVSLVSSSQTAIGSSTVVQFTLKANVVSPPVAT